MVLISSKKEKKVLRTKQYHQIRNDQMSSPRTRLGIHYSIRYTTHLIAMETCNIKCIRLKKDQRDAEILTLPTYAPCKCSLRCARIIFPFGCKANISTKNFFKSRGMYDFMLIYEMDMIKL